MNGRGPADNGVRGKLECDYTHKLSVLDNLWVFSWRTTYASDPATRFWGSQAGPGQLQLVDPRTTYAPHFWTRGQLMRPTLLHINNLRAF